MFKKTRETEHGKTACYNNPRGNGSILVNARDQLLGSISSINEPEEELQSRILKDDFLPKIAKQIGAWESDTSTR